MRITSGRSLCRGFDRLEAVGRLSGHLDVVLGLQDHPEAGAHQSLIVCD